MEKQNGFLGLSSKAWLALGVLGLAGTSMLICALVLLAFGVDAGGLTK